MGYKTEKLNLFISTLSIYLVPVWNDGFSGLFAKCSEEF